MPNDAYINYDDQSEGEYYVQLEYDCAPYQVRCIICHTTVNATERVLRQAGWVLSRHGVEICGRCGERDL